MRYQGKLSNWDDEKGFGFVEPNGGGDRSFVHIKSFQTRSKRPVDGDLIIYEQAKDAKGRFKAINVSFVRDIRAKPKVDQRKRRLGAYVSILFCLVLVATVFTQLIPIEIALIYVATNIVTLVVYAKDKSAAEKDGWRTSERSLHMLSLIGGWPAAFLAQNKLRHKSSKKEFKQVYWFTVVLNIGAFLWLLTQQGQQFIKTFIG